MKHLYLINAIGLAFDFIGFYLIFKYGVAQSTRKEGRTFIRLGGATKEELDFIQKKS